MPAATYRYSVRSPEELFSIPFSPIHPSPAFSYLRRELYEMYGWFVAAFREASEKLRAGNRMVSFPAGSFPPALPFVFVRSLSALV